MKKAVLVGINKYPDPDDELSGCINDITDMTDFIVKQKKFSVRNVKMLTDKKATKKNIVEKLNWLVEGAKAGDQLLFHYSGHGAQMASKSKAGEPDKLDEVICPWDFDWTDARALKDKDFAKLFSKVPKGVDFIWVSDSCHSADLSREIIIGKMFKVKAMIPPPDIALRNQAAAAGVHELGKSIKQRNLALISGCKSNQESADAEFSNRPNGALSFFLLKTLKTKQGEKDPLNVIVTKINDELKRSDFKQRPQLEGSEELMAKPFF